MISRKFRQIHEGRFNEHLSGMANFWKLFHGNFVKSINFNNWRHASFQQYYHKFHEIFSHLHFLPFFIFSRLTWLSLNSFKSIGSWIFHSQQTNLWKSSSPTLLLVIFSQNNSSFDPNKGFFMFLTKPLDCATQFAMATASLVFSSLLRFFFHVWSN